MSSLPHLFRALVRRPSFSGLMLALVTLATTATSATFAVVRATLWRELPYRDAGALANIYTTEPVNRDSSQQVASSAMLLARWRDNARTLSGVEGYSPINVSVAGDGDPEALTGGAISAGLFELLGTPPAVGRAFRREEEVATSGAIVISDAVAKRRFGGPTAALGKALTVDGEPRTVIGVMPPGFSLLFQGGDAWIPLDLSSEQQAKAGVRNIAVYGRLRPGGTLDQARTDLGAILRDAAATVPNFYAATQAAIRPLREALFGNRRPTMLVLIAAVALVLLIAIVNVANLTFADVLSRRTQTMTRVALGARPPSLLSARLTEIAVLSALSFAVALPLCAAALAVLALISPEAFVPLGNRAIDLSVALVALATAIALGTGGALPAALIEARTQATGIAGTVAKAGRSGDNRIRLVLGAAQAMITVVLLSVAVLLGRDLMRLMSTGTGLAEEKVVVVRMNVLSRERSTVPARAQYAEALVRTVSAVPGVVEVAAMQSRFNLNETMQSPIAIDGLVTAPGQPVFAQIRHVMPNLFRVLGIRVMAGRGIDSTDRADSRPVAVVSASLAKLYWPGESAIGKRIRRGAPGSPWLDVVGVVDDIMDAGLGVPLGPTFYVSYLQQNTATARVTLVLRMRASSLASGDAIRRAIWTVNSAQAIDDITPLPTLMARSAAQPRFRATVVGVFGVSAVVLVLAGVYAITVFNVLSRRRELGIRAAIGASPSSLMIVATRNSLNPVIIGGVAGALLTLPATNLTSSILQSQMRTDDLLVALGSVFALLGVAAVAALIPARGAARVSPTEAIRDG
jgi:putative ABC transport system permease protein